MQTDTARVRRSLSTAGAPNSPPVTGNHRGGGRAISRSTDLTAALAAHDPGNRFVVARFVARFVARIVARTDASGTAHTASGTLGSGPQTEAPRDLTTVWDTDRIGR